MKPLNHVRLDNGVAVTSYQDEETVLVEASVHVRLKDKSNFYPMLDSTLTDEKSERVVFEQFSELWSAKTHTEVAHATGNAMHDRNLKAWQLMCPTCKLPRHARSKCTDAFHVAKVK